MENINKFISSIDNSTPNKIRQSKSDDEFRRYLRENYCKQLNLTIVSQQRELLKAFADEFNDSTDTYILEGRIVTFLKAFNCG